MPSLATPLSLVELSAAPAAASASIAFVQTTAAFGNTNGTTTSRTLSAPTTVGNYLVIACYYGAGTVSFSGGGVTTFTAAEVVANVCAVYYGKVTSPGTVVVMTVTSTDNIDMFVSEWSGMNATTPLATSPTPVTYSNANPVVGPAMVAGSTGQLLYGFAQPTQQAATGEPGVGWVNIGTETFMQVDYLLGPSPGTYTPSWPMAGTTNGSAIGCVFNPVTVVAGVVPGALYYDTTLKQVGLYTGILGGWVYFATAAQAAAALAAATAARAAAIPDYPFLRIAYR